MSKKPFDCRRHTSLVQFLATLPSGNMICDFCYEWDVQPILKQSEIFSGLQVDYQKTIERLAEHAIQYDREEMNHE